MSGMIIAKKMKNRKRRFMKSIHFMNGSKIGSNADFLPYCSNCRLAGMMALANGFVDAAIVITFER